MNTHEHLNQSPNRVLLYQIDEWRRYVTPEGFEGMTIDGSFLPFMVEELIASSALKVVIPQGSVVARFAAQVPETIKPYISVFDSSGAFRKLTALLSPLKEEFGFIFSAGFYKVKRGSPDELKYAWWSLATDMLALFWALEAQAEVEIDLPKLKESIELLHTHARSGESRILLARIRGILNLYSTLEISGISRIPSTATDHMAAFYRLVEDSDYLKLSQKTHSLGFPSECLRVGQQLGRLTKALVTRAPFKQLFNMSAKVVTACTTWPMPDAESIDMVFGSRYFPPIRYLKGERERAKESWRLVEPPVIPWRKD